MLNVQQLSITRIRDYIHNDNDCETEFLVSGIVLKLQRYNPSRPTIICWHDKASNWHQ